MHFAISKGGTQCTRMTAVQICIPVYELTFSVAFGISVVLVDMFVVSSSYQVNTPPWSDLGLKIVCFIPAFSIFLFREFAAGSRWFVYEEEWHFRMDLNLVLVRVENGVSAFHVDPKRSLVCIWTAAVSVYMALTVAVTSCNKVGYTLNNLLHIYALIRL